MNKVDSLFNIIENIKIISEKTGFKLLFIAVYLNSSIILLTSFS